MKKEGNIHIGVLAVIVISLSILISINLNQEQDLANSGAGAAVLSEKDNAKNKSDEANEKGAENSNKPVKLKSAEEEIENEFEYKYEVEPSEQQNTNQLEYTLKAKEKKDGTTKVFFKDENVKVKFVYKQGEIVAEEENAEGETQELQDQTVEDFLAEYEEDTGTQILEDEVDNELVIERNGVRTRTNFPLTIGPSNELIVTTPKGSKVVTVLPDVAVRNMILNSGVQRVEYLPGQSPLPSVDPSATPIASASSEPTVEPLPTLSPEPTPEPVEGEIALTELNDELVYEINGIKEESLLGIIPVEVKIKYYVSAEDGAIVESEQELLSRILDLLAL